MATTTLEVSIEEAAKVLRAQGATAVYLFGSVATGRLREDSDVDLAVSGLPPERFLHAMGLAADVLDRPLSLVDLNEDTPSTRHLKSEGGLRLVGWTQRPSGGRAGSTRRTAGDLPTPSDTL